MRNEKIQTNSYKFNLKATLISFDCNQVAKDLHTLKESEISNYVNKLEGHFSIIFENSNKVLLICDKNRSFPIFYSTKEEFTYSFEIKKQNFAENLLNQEQIDFFYYSGYTIGDETLIKGIYSLTAGQYLLYKKSNKSLHKIRYYSFLPNDKIETQGSLSNLLLEIFNKLIKYANGKQIIIPLSAGYDSRLVVSCLSHLGYKNVVTFSYGLKDNFEAKIARKISNQLGYKWVFFETTRKEQRAFFESQMHKDYITFCTDYISVPFEQDIATILKIKSSTWLEEGAIIVNGNSGDFISGGHLNSHNTYPMQAYISKHLSLWPLDSNKEREHFTQIIKSTIIAKDSVDLELKLESHEHINRQSKYVINGQRAYEFCGLDWVLPLWDDKLLYFFQNASKQDKENQTLYKKVLQEENWGGVWKDLPVNKLEIKPNWVRPLRLLGKIACFPFGKKRWHNIEKRFFYYWMDVVCNITIVTYWTQISSKKTARNHVSWHTAIFLQKLLKSSSKSNIASKKGRHNYL